MEKDVSTLSIAQPKNKNHVFEPLLSNKAWLTINLTASGPTEQAISCC